MIKGMFGIAAALSLAASSFVPAAVAAKGFGPHHSVHAPFFVKPFARHHHRAFRHRRDGGLFEGYGDFVGGYGDYAIEPVSELFPPLRIDPVIPAPPALTCSRSRETITVPAESGGSRQVTITRC